MPTPQASLIVKDDVTQEFPLGADAQRLGSGDVCQVVLKGNGCASFTHAEVRFENGAYWLCDLGSRDGTRVNGAKVTRHALRNGDLILIGGVRITFVQPHAEAAAVPGRPPTATAIPAPAAPARAPGEETDRLPPLEFDMDNDALAASEKRQLRVLGIATVVAVLGFFASLPLFFDNPKPKSGGAVDDRRGIPWVDVTTEVGGSAFVTLPHKAANSADPTIAAVSSPQDGRNQIDIQGLRAGKTRVLVEGTRGQLWEVGVTIEEVEEWPPGWTDNDRLAAAEQLQREADDLYRDRDTREVNLVPCFYRYAKVVRLYNNCRYAPDAAHDECLERRRELEAMLTKKEIGHVRSMWNAFHTGNLPTARAHLNDLLSLFPEDGGDADVLSAHGNNQKHQQFFVLGLKLEQMARELRKQ